MKKISIVIIVAQSILIIFLILFLLVKSIEIYKHAAIARENHAEAIKCEKRKDAEFKLLFEELKKCKEENR